MRGTVMKGYKAFSKGMICRGKQYKENEIFEESGTPSLCSRGMHFCENPIEVLNYYSPCDSEYAEVEAIGDIADGGADSKVATNILKIGHKVDLKGLIKATVDYILEKTKVSENMTATTGNYANAATTGNYANAATTGDRANAATTGYRANAATTGDRANAATTGNYANATTTGYRANAATTGYRANAATTGNYANAATTGKNSIAAAIGILSKVKAAKGNWIVAAEWKRNDECEWEPVCVKSAKVDGETIKADTWYRVENGEFVETT
jgi:hypothetical protein